MVLLDAVTRLIPGVLGHADSAVEDSFSAGWLDCPHYTRPEEFDGQRVPEVLLSGNHELIRRWRLKQSLGRTWQRRPELLEELELRILSSMRPYNRIIPPSDPRLVRWQAACLQLDMT